MHALFLLSIFLFFECANAKNGRPPPSEAALHLLLLLLLVLLPSKP
jgi:hypothetical protein